MYDINDMHEEYYLPNSSSSPFFFKFGYSVECEPISVRQELKMITQSIIICREWSWVQARITWRALILKKSMKIGEAVIDQIPQGLQSQITVNMTEGEVTSDEFQAGLMHHEYFGLAIGIIYIRLHEENLVDVLVYHNKHILLKEMSRKEKHHEGSVLKTQYYVEKSSRNGKTEEKQLTHPRICS